MSIEYTGVGGVRKHYGPRLNPATHPDPAPSVESVAGNVNEIEVNFRFDNLPGPVNDGDDAVVVPIPANAYLIEAFIYEGVAFDSDSGTTTLDIGLVEADGTPIDADGIAAAVITADGTASGWTEAEGVVVGASVGADPAYVSVSASVDDLTAGQARLVVRYLRHVG